VFVSIKHRYFKLYLFGADYADRGATIIAAQLPISKWHELISDDTIADALLDRLIHKAYKIELKGESMRRLKKIL
jgi:DNA replication protein DnaC